MACFEVLFLPGSSLCPTLTLTLRAVLCVPEMILYLWWPLLSNCYFCSLLSKMSLKVSFPPPFTLCHSNWEALILVESTLPIKYSEENFLSFFCHLPFPSLSFVFILFKDVHCFPVLKIFKQFLLKLPCFCWKSLSINILHNLYYLSVYSRSRKRNSSKRKIPSNYGEFWREKSRYFIFQAWKINISNLLALKTFFFINYLFFAMLPFHYFCMNMINHH